MYNFIMKGQYPPRMKLDQFSTRHRRLPKKIKSIKITHHRLLTAEYFQQEEVEEKEEDDDEE